MKYILATLLIADMAAASITLTPGSILCSSYPGGRIYQFDGQTGQQIGTLDLQTSPPSTQMYSFAITVLNNELLVSYGSDVSGGFARVNTTTGMLTLLPLVGEPLGADGFATRNGRLVSSGAGNVDEINPATGEILTHINLEPIGWNPDSPQLQLPQDIAFNGTNYLSITQYSQSTGWVRAYNPVTGAAIPGSDFPVTQQFEYVAGLDFDISTNVLRTTTYLELSSGFRSFIRTYGASTPQISVEGVILSDVVTVPIPTPGVVTIFGAASCCAFRRRRLHS